MEWNVNKGCCDPAFHTINSNQPNVMSLESKQITNWFLSMNISIASHGITVHTALSCDISPELTHSCGSDQKLGLLCHVLHLPPLASSSTDSMLMSWWMSKTNVTMQGLLHSSVCEFFQVEIFVVTLIGAHVSPENLTRLIFQVSPETFSLVPKAYS